MVVFVGIVIWAWSAKRKQAFDEAARIPLEDDVNPVAKNPEKGVEHG